MYTQQKRSLQAFALAIVTSISSIAAAHESSIDGFGDEPLVRVTGTGNAFVKADLALLTLGVETQGKTAEEARAQAAAAMDAMLEAVKAAGIEDKDLQTQHLSLNPIYAPDTANRITGYQVQHQLMVKVRDTARVGAVIDAALKSGADSSRMYGLNFTVEDASAAEAEARAEAYADARAKAEQYATAAGFTLGHPIRIVDMPVHGPGPIPMHDMAMARMTESAPTPIATGEQEVTATVEVVYNVVEQAPP